MSYLSRIWLNPWRRQTQRFLRDPQAMHAAVLAGIPNQPVTERVLWRIDHHGSNSTAAGNGSQASLPEGTRLRPALYVLTQSHPSWEHLCEQAGWPSSAESTLIPAVRSYEPLLERLHEGDHFAFRLTANPTKTSRAPREDGTASSSRGSRVGQVTARHQLDWLTKRAERLGFAIPSAVSQVADGDHELDVRLIRRDRLSFSKGRGTKRRVTLVTATFDGHMIVRSPDLLRSALVDGIGPAKAYGCGLMTLAPLDGASM